MTTNATPHNKLLFGTLFVAASALPAGSIISGLLANVGANWVAEALNGVATVGSPAGTPLTRVFARAVQSATTQLHRTYGGTERTRSDGQDAFELLRGVARGITSVEISGQPIDLAGVQRSVASSLDQLLHGFPDAQVRLIREQLLPTTARAFHEELAREPEAWRLYHSWLLERMVAQSVALQTALAAQPATRATLLDPRMLENRLDSFSTRLDTLLIEIQDELRRATGSDIAVDQSEQTGGTSYGAFNQLGSFGEDQPPSLPSGKIRVNQSKQQGGVSYGAFNRVGQAPPDRKNDDTL